MSAGEDVDEQEGRARRRRRRRLLRVVVPIGSVLLAVSLCELTLQLTRLFPDAPPTHHNYGDVHGRGGVGGLKPGFRTERMTDGWGGHVLWENNAQGFRASAPIAQRPPPDAVRIIAIGDSFGVGYDVGQEDAYGLRVAADLSARGVPTESFLAFAESPAGGLRSLEKHWLAFAPDVVVQGVCCGNDIGTVYIGAITPTVSAAERKAAMTCPLPADTYGAFTLWRLGRRTFPRTLSSVGRAVLGRRYPEAIYDYVTDSRVWVKEREVVHLWGAGSFGSYLKPRDDEPEVTQHVQAAYDAMKACLLASYRLCRERGIDYVVVLHPQRFSVQARDWMATTNKYGLDASRFDLDRPHRELGAFCAQEGIPLVDPAAAMKAWYAAGKETLYLPLGDMHYSREGHHLVTAELLRILEPLARAKLKAKRGR